MTVYSEFSKEIIRLTTEVLLSWSQSDLSYSPVLDDCVVVHTKLLSMHELTPLPEE